MITAANRSSVYWKSVWWGKMNHHLQTVMPIICFNNGQGLSSDCLDILILPVCHVLTLVTYWWQISGWVRSSGITQWNGLQVCESFGVLLFDSDPWFDSWVTVPFQIDSDRCAQKALVVEQMTAWLQSAEDNFIFRSIKNNMTIFYYPPFMALAVKYSL